MEVIEVN